MNKSALLNLCGRIATFIDVSRAVHDFGKLEAFDYWVRGFISLKRNHINLAFDFMPKFLIDHIWDAIHYEQIRVKTARDELIRTGPSDRVRAIQNMIYDLLRM